MCHKNLRKLILPVAYMKFAKLNSRFEREVPSYNLRLYSLCIDTYIPMMESPILKLGVSL